MRGGVHGWYKPWPGRGSRGGEVSSGMMNSLWLWSEAEA